jgi:argininosuccinate synthase
MNNLKQKVVLAYSGGLDTSVILKWLVVERNLEVIAVCIDIGQNEDFEYIKTKALKTGAVQAMVIDAKEEFVKSYIYPTLKAGAIYEDDYLLGTSFARPLISKLLVNIAHAEGAKFIAHGATGKGNDQVRFEATVMALDPSIQIIAPWREWQFKSREDLLKFAEEQNIEVPNTLKDIYSRDENLWHTSHEGGELEDPWSVHNTGMYKRCVTPENSPEKGEIITLRFFKGIPTHLNGHNMYCVDLIQELNKLAAAHGVGIVDMVENRLVGMKSRGVYETPAGTVLFEAHKCLEKLVLDRDTISFKRNIAQKYAQLVYDGLWHSSLKTALDCFVDETQQVVTGVLKVKLFKGRAQVIAMRSQHSLYSEALSTFGESDMDFNHKDAEGFIHLFALPLKIKAMMNLADIDGDEVAI